MIFNKFRPITFCNKVKTLSLQLLTLSLFSCNKSANINANKAYVGLTHVAYGVGPISLTIDGTLLFSNPLAFGLTTGIDGNPYDTTVSRISEMNIFLAQDTTMSIHGNAAFQQGSHYSVFFFDTLDPRSVTLIILQDNPPVRTDTFTYIRYMNFSPDSSWGIKLINTRKDIPYYADTINIGPSLFVGHNINPSAYYFSLVRIGNYNVFAFRDSINPAPDSSNFIHLGPLQIDSTINYNVFLQGFFKLDSGINKFQLMSVSLN